MIVAGRRRHIRHEFVGLSQPDQNDGIGGESMATSAAVRMTNLSKERFGSISGPICQKSEV
jgi:hypothetical protein